MFLQGKMAESRSKLLDQKCKRWFMGLVVFQNTMCFIKRSKKKKCWECLKQDGQTHFKYVNYQTSKRPSRQQALKLNGFRIK